MAGSQDINELIKEAIHKHSDNEAVERLLLESIQYELDIWNRYPPKKDIIEQYESIINKILHEFE